MDKGWRTEREPKIQGRDHYRPQDPACQKHTKVMPLSIWDRPVTYAKEENWRSPTLQIRSNKSEWDISGGKPIEMLTMCM